jgi:VIT1/CCC1 family predicted Fe2+/Mn2+ transporter
VAVLAANDGIICTASLRVGVAAAATTRGEVLTAGLVGLVAAAMSMAADEYVSVSSQFDPEAPIWPANDGTPSRCPRRSG